MCKNAELKEKLAVEELRERNFRWDSEVWISGKSGFFYGRGKGSHDSAVNALESVGFQWCAESNEWLEPPVLGEDFEYEDCKLGIKDALVIMLVVAFFAGVGVLGGVMK